MRLKLNTAHEKISNHLYELSTKLEQNFDIIAIEDLNIKGLFQALNFGKSVIDSSFEKFVEMLKYKFKELGKALIKIYRFFLSSKTCS